MDRQGKECQGGMMGRRLIAGLLVLNLLVLLAGAAWEYWQTQPRSLPLFNADKIRLLSAEHPPAAPSPARSGGVESAPLSPPLSPPSP